jgi:hypothetical protein
MLQFSVAKRSLKGAMSSLDQAGMNPPSFWPISLHRFQAAAYGRMDLAARPSYDGHCTPHNVPYVSRLLTVYFEQHAYTVASDACPKPYWARRTLAVVSSALRPRIRM